MRRSLAVTALAAAFFLAALPSAFACACCANEGQRYVTNTKLEPRHLEIFKQLRFAKKANLYTGERDLTDIKGIINPSASYDLTVTFANNRFVFVFRDGKKNEGTLTLAVPDNIALFEIDPREPDGSKNGLGPTLYKEWRLIASFIGSGIFRSGNNGYQRIALIAQGRGNNCTDTETFTHWALSIYGPAGEYLFFGDLVKP